MNGEAYEPADAELYDFNGDHVANGEDAQHLLNYCAGLVADAELYNADIADLDEDGDIDTYDARLAFNDGNEFYDTADVDSHPARFRINIGCPRQVLQEALDRLSKFLG